MTPRARRSQFCFGSDFDDELRGVMDVFFAASCFQKPSIHRMETLFWFLAKEFISLHVDSSDKLNFLLWGSLLPQTVLTLAPIMFHVDSLIPPIEVMLTIEGTSTSVPKDDLVEGSFSSEVLLPSNMGMIFRSDARIINVTFRRLGLSTLPYVNNLLSFVGKAGVRNDVYLNTVQVYDGGLNAIRCNKVHGRGVVVFGATVGVSLDTVADFVFTEFVSDGASRFPEAGIFSSRIAFSFHQVDGVEIDSIRVSSVGHVLVGSISNMFVMSNSCIDYCSCMGHLNVLSDIRPVFHTMLVRFFHLIFYFLVLLMLFDVFAVWPWDARA